jgi:unsaturated chondroitin disaccharide hydrolase
MLKRLQGSAAALAVALCMLPATAHAGDRLDRAVARDLSFAAHQLKRTLAETPANRYPRETGRRGRWKSDTFNSWTAGFFPGSLWLMYEATGKPRWRKAAKKRQRGLERLKRNTRTHDVGFLINDSFGQGYRLTGNDRFRRVVVRAARSLATRYSPTVRAIRSLNNRFGTDASDFRVIIDNLMNLELLFWASRHGGPHDLASKALDHAFTTAREHLRPNASSYHLVTFDARTGRVKHKRTIQGYRDWSTWSRGQAWAVYGYTMAYRETLNPWMLITARRVADYYIDHLPGDRVPYWDFQAPGIPHAPRDSSAGAVAASGLIELSELEPDAARRQRYLSTAKRTLRSLSSKRYLARGTRSRSILLHGTANRRGGDFNRGLIYGDYYFLEALLRYRALTPAR